MPSGVGDVAWTPAFCRMIALIYRCIKGGEPALLVGETGGGKTMACQLLSWALIEGGDARRQLNILNCHQQTETADFIGSLRPVRGRDAVMTKILADARELEAALLPGEAAGEQEAALRRELGLILAGGGSPKLLAAALRAAMPAWAKGAAAAAAAAAAQGAQATEPEPAPAPAQESPKKKRRMAKKSPALKPAPEPTAAPPAAAPQAAIAPQAPH